MNIPVTIPRNPTKKNMIVGDVVELIGKKKKFIKLQVAAKFWKEMISNITPRTIVPDKKNTLKLRIIVKLFRS